MLDVQNLHKSYQVGKTTYPVLKGVSFQVETGEFVAVMGPSGSGKTTLLNCISCYIPTDQGCIQLGGKDIAKLDEEALAQVRNRQLGFVFQDFLLLDGLTVRQNILLPATIFMVTHDSFAASFCDRVLMLKDGKLWRTLERGNTQREVFQDRLLEAIGEMSRE